MIKRTLVFTALLLGIAALAFAQRPDYSGTWRLDAGESQITTDDGLEGLGHHAPDTLYITQQGNGAVLISSRLPRSQPRAYQMGGESWVEAPRPGTRQLLMSSRTRGLSMVSVANGEADGERVSVREVLTMGRYGDKITLEVTTTRSWGPQTNKLVYDRVGGGGAPGRR